VKQYRKNVLRGTLRRKSSFIGAVLIIAIGVFIFVSMLDTMENLNGQIRRYYARSELADVFAEVEGISPGQLSRLEEIPGIRKASGRLAEDVRVLNLDTESVVTLHLLSLDADDAGSAALNRPMLSGNLDAEDGIAVGVRMTEACSLKTGSRLELLGGGQRKTCRFSCTVQQPDYIYSIPPGGAMVPDGKVYDIAVMETGAMEKFLGKRDSLNELGFRLDPGTTYEDVRAALMDRLEPYGLKSIVKQSDQPSVSMVEGELVELISTGTILPLIFMAVSVFMLYVVLRKRVEQDESLIGTMKACGMTDRELMEPYLAGGAAAGLAGALAGCIPAELLGRFMFDLYIDFFTLPDPSWHNVLRTRLLAVGIAAGTGTAAAWLGTARILKITPVEAMRGDSPGGTGFRLPAGLFRRLGTFPKLGIRSALRKPFRGVLIALAIAFPFSMTSVLTSFMPLVIRLFEEQYSMAETYDLMVSLRGYDTPARVKDSAAVFPEVQRAEPMLRVSFEARKENLKEFGTLYGVPRDKELRRIMDNRQRFYDVPQDGVILNYRVADRIGASAGDVIWISGPGFTVDEIPVKVSAVIAETLGRGCYMDLSRMGTVMNTPPAANLLLLKAEGGAEGKARLIQKLVDAGNVTAVSDSESTVGNYVGMVDSMISMINMFALLSAAAGFILFFQISMINIRERKRELGSMMVLGASEGELGMMLTAEHVIYFILGILLGYPGSLGVAKLIEVLIISDDYDIPIRVSRGGYGLAFVTCLAITLAAGIAEYRYLHRLSLTEILKSKE